MDDKWFYAVVGAAGTVLGSLLLNVIGNLITPDRKRLVDWIRDQWARQSSERARKRVKKLEEELETLSRYAEDPGGLSLYFWQVAFGIFRYLALAALFIFAFSRLKIFDGLIATLAGAIPLKILFDCNEAMSLSNKVCSFNFYEALIEQQIAELQEKITGILDISGTWRGTFCDGQPGVLDIEQNDNSLQATLTTHCLHLGTDEVYHERLTGDIKGRKVILIGRSASRPDSEEVLYELDNFDLTLSADERTLRGMVSDKNGDYKAEFHRES